MTEDSKRTLLREEAPPGHAVDCRMCELAEHRRRVVWGEGNPNGALLVVLDNPGLREDAEGNPFLCGTRDTLQAGLEQAGISIDSVYVTYLLKCRPVRAYNKPLARQACSAHFQLQLSEKRPRWMIGMGNTVVQTLFPDEDEEVDVKSFRGRWHSFQGIPVLFTYHPLAVRRRPALRAVFVRDLEMAASRMKEG